jgi:DnaJ-domain-containing protein 1
VVTDKMLRQAQERTGVKTEETPTEPSSVLERLDDGGPVDPSDLVEGPDLPDETKKRILRLHRRMRKLAPHDLLGVASDADGAAIKRAFAAASKELHPDRYFGKNLGTFREKLAKIFARLSEAVQELEKARKAKK